MPSTAVWVAQDTAFALLLAEREVDGSALEGVTVSLGQPGRWEIDHVVVGGEVAEWARTPDSTTHDDEVFQLRLHVYSQQSTDEYIEARARVEAMLEAALAALTPDHWIPSPAPVYAVRVARGQVEETYTSEDPPTRAVLATVWLECRAMIDHPLPG